MRIEPFLLVGILLFILWLGAFLSFYVTLWIFHMVLVIASIAIAIQIVIWVKRVI